MVPHEVAALRVRTLGGEAAVCWELHIPLNHGERAIGVATLGSVLATEFDASEAATLQRLAGQAAVALAEAGALAQRNWLFQVNGAVLDGVREGIALVGLDHELVLSNAAMERLAGRLSMPISSAIGAPGTELASTLRTRSRAGRTSSPTATSRPPTSSRSAASCWSATRRRSTTRRGAASAAWSCCATSPASARPSG